MFKNRRQRVAEENARLYAKLSPASKEIYKAQVDPQFAVREWIHKNPGRWMNIHPWDIRPGDVITLVGGLYIYHILSGGPSPRVRGIQYETQAGVLDIDGMGGGTYIYVTDSGAQYRRNGY